MVATERLGRQESQAPVLSISSLNAKAGKHQRGEVLICTDEATGASFINKRNIRDPQITSLEMLSYIALRDSSFAPYAARVQDFLQTEGELHLTNYQDKWEDEFREMRSLVAPGSTVSTQDLLDVLDRIAAAQLQAFQSWSPHAPDFPSASAEIKERWENALLSHEMDEWGSALRPRVVQANREFAEILSRYFEDTGSSEQTVTERDLLTANINVNGISLGSIDEMIREISRIHHKNEPLMRGAQIDPAIDPEILIVRAGDGDLGLKNLGARVRDDEIVSFVKWDMEKLGPRVVVAEALAIMLKAVSAQTMRLTQPIIPSYKVEDGVGELSFDLNYEVSNQAMEWERRALEWVKVAAESLGMPQLYEQVALCSAWNHLHGYAYGQGEDALVSLALSLKRFDDYKTLKNRRLARRERLQIEEMTKV